MSDWQELGTVKSGLDMGSSPVVMRVSKSTRIGDLSYEFGILRHGKVQMMRYWREERLYSMATLTKAATSLSLTSRLAGVEINREQFKLLIERNDFLVLVEDVMTGRQERQSKGRFGASIGQLTGKRK